RHGVVHDLDHPSAHQLLVLHQRQIRLHTGCVAVHKKSDRAGGGKNGDLGVAVAEFLAMGEGFVPASLGSFVERHGNVGLVDVVYRSAVHADDVQERLTVDIPAGAGGAGHD